MTKHRKTKTSFRLSLITTFISTLLCGAAVTTNAASAQPDNKASVVKSFIQHPDISDVTISPDGEYLAALVPDPDDPYENLIAIFDAQTLKIAHLLRSGIHQMLLSYFWVSDNRVVASVAKQHTGIETPLPSGELLAMNIDGSNSLFLFGVRAGGMQTGTAITQNERRNAAATPISTHTIADNKILIAIRDFAASDSGYHSGAFTSAAVLNVKDGKTIGLGESPERNAYLIADHAGQVRVATADNDFKGVKLWVRPANDTPWALINDPSKSAVQMVPVGFNRSNDKLYLRVSQPGQPDAIELMDLASSKLTKLYQGKFADPGAVLETADGNDYYAVISNDGQRSLVYLDESSNEAQLSKALAVNFPGQLAYFSSFTKDGKRAVVSVQSDRNPGEYYLFDLDTHSARYLMSAKPWIDAKQMQPMQSVSLQARDGTSLHGFLTLPKGNKPYPFIVLPHDGPHGIYDTWGFNDEAQLFANQGYAVLQVNYRGSGGYGLDFERLGYRQWGLSMQDDLTDATRWAIAQGYAATGRICIYGSSYGGYAALEGAAREPDLYKCAIGYAGIYDLRVQLDKSDTQKSDRGIAYLNAVLGDDRDDLLRRSPLKDPARIKASILLLHGGSDLHVPIANFNESTKALDSQGKQYESLVEPEEGHGFFLPEHQLEAYQKMLGFLDENIGSGSSAPAGTTTH